MLVLVAALLEEILSLDEEEESLRFIYDWRQKKISNLCKVSPKKRIFRRRIQSWQTL